MSTPSMHSVYIDKVYLYFWESLNHWIQIFISYILQSDVQRYFFMICRWDDDDDDDHDDDDGDDDDDDHDDDDDDDDDAV